MEKYVNADCFFLSLTEEEKWLNKMSADGYELVKKGYYRYVFKKSDARLVYAVECFEHPVDNDEYRELLKEKEKNGQWLCASYKCRGYFASRAEDNSEALFTASAKTRLASAKNMFWLYAIIFAVSVFMCCYNCCWSFKFASSGSIHTMDTLTAKAGFLKPFESLAKLIGLPYLLGDFKSTLMAFVFFIISLILASPTALYLGEVIRLKKIIKSEKAKENTSDKNSK